MPCAKVKQAEFKFFFPDYSLILTFSSIILLLAATLYYCFAVIFLSRGLKKLRPAGSPQNLTFSVVIAARNEEKCIGKCLESVLGQTIATERYEVIVVNDRSDDGTAAICAGYQQRHANLAVVTITEIPAGTAPKKHAVSVGVSRARNEIVILTDADCMVPARWLEIVDRYFSKATGIVQGITAYEKPAGMNKFFFGIQAIDFLSHGVVAAAAIGAGMPLNSNANNFAFRKKAFDEAGGYGAVSQRVVSGDDDLLLQRIAAGGRWKAAFMADPEGAVATAPTPSLKGVFEQRKRWGSKTVNYSPRRVAFLSGVFLFYLCLLSALLAGLSSWFWIVVFGVMLAVKIAGEYALMLPGTALFKRESLRPYIFPASLLQLPLVLASVTLGVFGKFSWKGERYARTVK